MRKFNVTGICVPNMHYMVDISEKIEKIFALVEDSNYFTFNRGRQYGKTTTLGRLKKRIAEESDYICVSISFQYSTEKIISDEEGFCQWLLRKIHRALLLEHKEEAKLWLEESITDFEKLDHFITERCKNKKIVLIVDDSDRVINNYLFVRLLDVLKSKYLKKSALKYYTFQSVIF